MQYQLFPDLTKDEYAELKADIAERGVMVPIEYDEKGNIMDGHHRKQICDELGIKDFPWVTRYGMTEQEKRQHIRKLNLARRHLTKEQRNQIVKDMRADGISTTRISEETGIPQSTVSRVTQDTAYPNGQPDDSPATVTGKDGKTYPATKPRAVRGEANKDLLKSHEPEIAEKIASGKASDLPGAIRETKREEIVSKLEDISAKESKAIEGVYDVIVIDPPWPMEKIERDKVPEQVKQIDYPKMTEAELQEMEVPCADDAHVWLWTTHKFWMMAYRLLVHWELRYVCCFVWHKPGGFQPVGLPQYNCEFALYARKGSPSFIDTKSFNTCFEAPRTKHSEKPEVFYEMVRRATAGRRLDMFNRREIEGFDRWGNEA